jgi:thioredoxin reductase (NADPH)/alkyl hydroperoxide reductase subunit F
MAASLGMSTILVEQQSLCHKLKAASSLTNVLGGFGNGADLAAQIRQDIAGLPHCQVLLGRRAAHVRANPDSVAVRLDNRETIIAPYAVVATGVGPLRLGDVDWILGDIDDPPPLWQATLTNLTDAEVIVLGVDRPLGTLLRSMPEVTARLIVAYHPAEQYKAGEVSHDPRVDLIPTSHATLRTTAEGLVRLHTTSGNDDRTTTAGQIFNNLGSRPIVPDGDITTGHDGYCSPDRQHGRVLIAGDLRSPRYQRIMTAFGSGAEAALTAYYQLVGIR